MAAAEETVLAAMRALIAQVPPLRAFAGPLPDGPKRPVAPASLPVCAVLAGIAAAASDLTRDMTQAVAAAAPGLCWRQTYGASDFGAAFLRGYGWSEVIGQRGPVHSDHLAAGVLLLAPGITYPAHAHEAEELYLPLSGTALWQRGTEDFAPVAPGRTIHHPSWMPHAMHTLDQPLLALYLWRGGDLSAKSVILGRT